MASTFTWLDYSEQERRRALDAISLFRLQETRDELGLASIRDAFADRFFPGTSTIQTRARYFLLVPWLCKELEEKRVASADAPERLRRMEEELAIHLRHSDDADGAIGRDAGKAVKRMPSSIFWAGLGRWKILTFEGSLTQYLRSLDRFYRNEKHHPSMLDADTEYGPRPKNWHSHLPRSPLGFRKSASLSVDVHEAVYLKERILNACPGTLLAYLADCGERWERTDFVWFHDLAADFPNDIIHDLSHARLFSEVMHGATRLYNVMLSDALGLEERREHHRVAFETWADERKAQAGRLGDWYLRDFWMLLNVQGARVTHRTRDFVNEWIELTRESQHPILLLESPAARELILRREKWLKKARSRFSNRRHLELWKGDSGTRQLDFRWTASQRLLMDIVEGLNSTRKGVSEHA